VHSVLRNGELVVIIVTKLNLFFLICYIGVVISGTPQGVTLCSLIMISIYFFCGTAVLLGLGHLIV
jgi:hypothetical protein